MSTAPEWRHGRAVVNGVGLHYVEAGSGPLVVLLHGFPEFWYSWRHQIPALAAAGFHVIAPDQRGYNLSDKPQGVDQYRVELLADDIAALVAHAGYRRAHIAGHDWGGGIAWSIAMRHPELVDRLVVLNAPHPAVFMRELHSFDQLLRSWYILYFQLPILPELLLRSRNFAFLDRTFRKPPVRPGAFTREDVRLYKEALGQPGALTAALNYYRAAYRRRRHIEEQIRIIRAPTLLIWGEQDHYLGPRLTEGLEPWVPDLRIERIPEASHWVQMDIPQRVNQLLRGFLASHQRELH